MRISQSEFESQKWKAENEHIKESFPDAVWKEVAKQTVELERDSAMAIADTFESERDTAPRQHRAAENGRYMALLLCGTPTAF